MKRYATTILSLILLVEISFGQTTFVKGASVITYSLPKTEFVIEVTSEKITEQPGLFYLYANRYLSTTDVITQPKTYYRFKDIKVIKRTVPDEKRTYSIIPQKKSPTNLLTTNGVGLLAGINIPPPTSSPQLSPPQSKIITNAKEPQTLLPLLEEYMMASSTTKMAEGAAKQIYRIRENRLDLLGGYTESIPKDGQAVKTLIEQMDIEEEKLTQLFVGTINKQNIKQTLLFTPTESAQNLPIFRYSEYMGVVEADDLSGDPIYLTLQYTPYRHVDDGQKKRKSKYQEVFTVIPIFATMTLTYQGKELYREDVVLPQLGITQPIPFREIKKNSQIYVDTETGKLKAIVNKK